MTVIVKLITEQTTNLLEASVNKAQIDGWYPVCGVVWFNARYTQLMAHDSDGTEVPKCNYFLVDSEDGIDFANRVNKLVALNTGASCLSSVQYVNARYIQAWGDDTLHHGGGDLPKWYTEDTAKTYPIIDVDPNLSQIGLGNEWAGYVQLLFRTGGNNAGYILADDGTMTLHKAINSQLNLSDDSAVLHNHANVEMSNADVTLNIDGNDLTISDVGGIREQLNADRSALVAPTGTADLTLAKEGLAQLSANVSIALNAGSNATMSTIDATGFVKDTAGEYHYKIDGNLVFFSSGDITKMEAGDVYLEMDANTDEILLPPTYTPTVSNSVANKGYVDNTRPVNAVFRASFTTTNVETSQYVTADNTPQVVTFNAQAIPNAALGTLNNATGIFTAAREIVGTLAVTCQVRRTTGGAAAVTWGFQVETSPDGSTWTPTPGSARYINLRGAGDNNVLQTVNLTAAVDIPAGTRVRITQMTDTSSANVGLVALPAMLGGATAAGLVFSLSTTI